MGAHSQRFHLDFRALHVTRRYPGLAASQGFYKVFVFAFVPFCFRIVMELSQMPLQRRHIFRIAQPDGPLIERVTILGIKFVCFGDGCLCFAVAGINGVNLSLPQPCASTFVVQFESCSILVISLRDEATAIVNVTALGMNDC